MLGDFFQGCYPEKVNISLSEDIVGYLEINLSMDAFAYDVILMRFFHVETKESAKRT